MTDDTSDHSGSLLGASALLTAPWLLKKGVGLAQRMLPKMKAGGIMSLPSLLGSFADPNDPAIASQLASQYAGHGATQPPGGLLSRFLPGAGSADPTNKTDRLMPPPNARVADAFGAMPAPPPPQDAAAPPPDAMAPQAPPPAPPPQVPMPPPRPSMPGAPPAFSPSMIPGYNANVGNMADPQQSAASLGPNTQARQIMDPASGNMMNDFYNSSTTDGPALIKKFMASMMNKAPA